MDNAISCIDKIRLLPYHDGTLLEMTFNFEKRTIKINFENNFNLYEIEFVGVFAILLSNFQIDEDFSDVEIYSVDFELTGNSFIEAKFIFLTGFGKPGGELIFSFQGVKNS